MSIVTVATSNRELLQANNLLDPGVDFDRVRLHVGGMPTWYLRVIRRGAITLGSQIWFRNEEKRDNLALVAHELVHVAQYGEMGVVRFWLRYLKDMAKAGFKYSKQLPLEAPAYARQRLAEEVLGLR